MGRIDEALQRSARGPVAVKAQASAKAETFVSPWTFRDVAAVADGTPAGGSRADAVLQSSTAGELHGFRRFQPDWSPRLVVDERAGRAVVEQFSHLAATLHKAQEEHKLRTVLVTSAEPAEGKSLTSVNLALTLSGSYGRRVLLIDADLRRPALHEILQLPSASGLGDTLKSESEQKLPIYRISETLMVAPAGRCDPNPMAALSSPRMPQLLAEAATRYDWVLIDAPPVGPIADASLLAPLADGALLVIRAGRTHYAAVQKAIEVVGRERLIGVVLNGAELVSSSSYHYYYDAYHTGASLRE